MKSHATHRTVFGIACLCVLGLVAFLGAGAPSVGAAESFPGQGFLPDNRAWEMVSPPDKNGGQVIPSNGRIQASADCATDCRVSFASLSAFGDAQGIGVAAEYIAGRVPGAGDNGWRAHAITPKQEPMTALDAFEFREGAYRGDLSPDLSTGVFRAFSPLTDDPDVAAVNNLYTRADLLSPGAGSYRLDTECPHCEATETPLLPNQSMPVLAGVSADYRHVAFESRLNLTGASGSLPKVYASDDGLVRLVGLVPAGASVSCGGPDPACVLPSQQSGASIAGLGASQAHYTPNVVSEDGTRINFTASLLANGAINQGAIAANRSKLYQSDSHGTVTTADDTTVRVNASERVIPATAQAALYMTASTDGSRVFFTTSEPLTDDAPASGSHLYMWHRDELNDERQRLTVSATAGQFRLVFSGEPTADLSFQSTPAQIEEALEGLLAISTPGGEVTVTGGPGDELGAAPYTIAFSGGLAATDLATMTTAPGTTPLSGGAATATVAPRVKGGGHLTLIDVDREPGDAHSPVEGVIGASEDGSRVYFVAAGQLVAGQPVIASQRAIYLWHEGEITYIGAFKGTSNDWTRNQLNGGGIGAKWALQQIASRVTPDGGHLLFAANDASFLPTPEFPSGYDHHNCGNQTGCQQFYLYDAEEDELECASCNRETGQAGADATTKVGFEEGASVQNSHVPNSLSEDGRYVFFTSAERYVQADINGLEDAYRYDSESGDISLLSSGESAARSHFADASTDGSDAFFLTRERLSRWDVDDGYDLYDARVGGGLPEPPPIPPSCVGDACQPAVIDLNDPTPSSSSFKGAGDPRPVRPRACPRGKRRVLVKRGRARSKRGRARCVTRKRQQHTKRNRRASDNRRAGR